MTVLGIDSGQLASFSLEFAIQLETLFAKLFGSDEVA